MTRLLDPDEMEKDAERVRRELANLLARADAIRDRIDNCQALDDQAGVAINTRRLAGIARMLTRAQAGLVHPGDPRHDAALAVIEMCDDEDRRNPWTELVELEAA